ncbi:hypothetical protein [Massilia sp. TWR1-2-2]|uniref:hypothetical protein n=1 Tax=Massilia sp. TWR1-2-2 TaxID=2804584 RepID=UPI003CF61621
MARTWATAAPAPLSPATFDAALETTLHEQACRNVREVPRIAAISDAGQAFDLDYYLRHRIETVHRIRMTAGTDALALAAMVAEHFDAARRWADYTAEEMKHDRFFLADLARHGWDAQRVLAVPPLRGTVALIDYLRRQIASVGSIAAVAYSIYVEWHSARFSRPAVERAEQALGAEFVKGAKAHLAVDVKEDHCQEMVDIAYLLAGHDAGLRVLRALVVDIAGLLRESFIELHLTVAEPAPET